MIQSLQSEYNSREIVDAVVRAIEESHNGLIHDRGGLAKQYNVSRATFARIGYLYRISKNEKLPEDLRTYATKLLTLVRDSFIRINTAYRHFHEYAATKYGTVLVEKKFSLPDNRLPRPTVPIKKYDDPKDLKSQQRAYARAVANLEGFTHALESLGSPNEDMDREEINNLVDRLFKARTLLTRLINQLRRKGAESSIENQES